MDKRIEILSKQGLIAGLSEHKLAIRTCLAMDEYAELKWNEGCAKLLEEIADTFLKNIDKADRSSDKDVFEAIGLTIQKFPIPYYKLSLHTGA